MIESKGKYNTKSIMTREEIVAKYRSMKSYEFVDWGFINGLTYDEMIRACRDEEIRQTKILALLSVIFVSVVTIICELTVMFKR